MEYGDRRLFAFLSLLYPFVDLRNHFHIDHVYPVSLFTTVRLRQAGVPEDRAATLRTMANRVGNLQLLEGAFNNEKRQKLPFEWLMQRYPSDGERRHYCQMHDLGQIPTDVAGFADFYQERRRRLRERITMLLDA